MQPESSIATRVRRRLGRARARLRERQQARRQVGPRPEVTLERTHLGPVMDQVVHQARLNQAGTGDPAYDLVRDHFDHYTFVVQSTPVQDQPDIDPIEFFLANGTEAVNSPDINFSPREYLRRYPHYAETPGRSPYLRWLEHGRASGEIGDPSPNVERVAEVLDLSTADLVAHLGAERLDLQERFRTGRLGEMFAKAAEIEPLIGESWVETVRPKHPPMVSHGVADQVRLMYRCHRQADHRRARLVFVINRPRWGGGRRVEGHLAYALQRYLDADDIVVIYTDASGTTPATRFPAGVRVVDFAREAEELEPPLAQRSLVELIRSFRADAVVNVNSRLLYEALTPYGLALASSERIFTVMFNNEQTATGIWNGYPLRYFYRYFDILTGAITDSHALRDWLRESYRVPEEWTERMHVLSAPVEPDLPVASPRPKAAGERPQVFWAGRWDRQKRIDVVLEVARRMPDVDFRMWGEPLLGGPELTEVPANVRLQGRYGHISELDLDAADAWLYTSAWDGVPSQLLEVAMTAIPLVGSLSGGTGEVLQEGLAWGIAAAGDADAYVAALRELLADPAEARRRAHALRERMLAERSAEVYGDQAARLLLRDPVLKEKP